MADKLTVSEVFALFGRTPEQARTVSSADSEEFLTLASYLMSRLNQWHQRPA